jgi:hypothetical protein
MPGYWSYGAWYPGYWQPVALAPVQYVYVPGVWYDEAYTEGYYRSEDRDGWTWVEGYYLEDGTAIPGHWIPTGDAPEGYSWEPGYFDGEGYVDGFWRPEFRPGFAWVSALFDTDGVFHSGYWLPLEDQQASVWIPGWFDGNVWIEGYWVSEEEYVEEDLDNFVPEDGYDAGWDGKGEPTVDQKPLPLALPVPG